MTEIDFQNLRNPLLYGSRLYFCCIFIFKDDCNGLFSQSVSHCHLLFCWSPSSLVRRMLCRLSGATPVIMVLVSIYAVYTILLTLPILLILLPLVCTILCWQCYCLYLCITLHCKYSMLNYTVHPIHLYCMLCVQYTAYGTRYIVHSTVYHTVYLLYYYNTVYSLPYCEHSIVH